jgi:astacin
MHIVALLAVIVTAIYSCSVQAGASAPLLPGEFLESHNEVLTAEDPQTRVFGNGLLYGISDPIPITYEIVDGLAVFEGDIILGHATQQGFDKGVEHGAVISSLPLEWPNGVIGYDIVPSLSTRLKERIALAIRHWEERTSITIVLRTADNASQLKNYVSFTKSSGCASYVGMQGGGQEIFLSEGCSTGSIIHEIGHALGLWHEHSREDRDDYIRILWENIEPTLKHNFRQHIDDGDDAGEYDYSSIMHYGRFVFSMNGLPTIEPLADDVAIGQRRALSDGDISAIEDLYGQSAQCATLYGGLGGSGVGIWIGFDYYPTGELFGFLRGPSDADFNLYLWKWNAETREWSVVAQSESVSSYEKISYSGAPGYYIWQVLSREGKGNYSFCFSPR